jgi:trigger factor
MKTEIVDVSQTRKEFKIELEAEQVQAELERVAGEYARAATVPGFRKGHAPVAVVRTRFKKDIRSDVLQRLVPQAVEQALLESGFDVIGQPDVHLDPEHVEDLGQGPLTFHVHVEVFPEVALGEYKGLAAARRVRPVTDETVEGVINNLREASAALQPVEDRPAQSGDTVTVDFQGRYVEPPEDEDINVSDVDVVLGGDGIVKEFNEHLTGVRPDEVKTFTVAYPEDFSSKGLAGKTIEYTATVTAVRRKELPEIDDDWVKSLGEEDVETVEALRERVRENLTKHAEGEAESRVRDEVMDRLLERHQFEVPETLVSYQANQMLQSTLRDMMRRGLDPRSQEVNWEALRDVVAQRASEDVRGTMLLERVAEAEQIEVTEEEVEAEIQSLAEGTRQSPEQVRAALTKQGGERSIADRLRNRKALDLLVQHAIIREEEWRDEEPAAEPETAGAEGAGGVETDPQAGVAGAE